MELRLSGAEIGLPPGVLAGGRGILQSSTAGNTRLFFFATTVLYFFLRAGGSQSQITGALGIFHFLSGLALLSSCWVPAPASSKSWKRLHDCQQQVVEFI